jgi:serine/threonine-protein kinase
MGITRPWRLSRWTEVRELHQGRCGRIVLAWPAPVPERRAGAGDEPPDGGGTRHVRPAVVRYVPARLLVHRARATAFRADVDRLGGLRLAEAAVPSIFVQAPAFRAAYERSGAAVGGALVSDAVEGTTLVRLLERHGALSGPAATVLFHGVLRALAAAHARRTAHGDLRAGKVMVSSDGGVTVTGLGLAALTTGAPELRAPELWRSTGAPTGPADVYAAGCLLYLCLTGQPPFPVRQLFSLMARHTTATVSLAGIPAPLREPLAAGLTKDPERRPGAEALLAETQRSIAPGWEEQGRSELGTLAAPLVEPLPRTPPRKLSTPLWPIRPAGRTTGFPSPSRGTAPHAEEFG